MLEDFENAQKMSKENLDALVKGFGAMQKNFGVIASEITSYTRKTIEQSSFQTEELIKAGGMPEKTLHLQVEHTQSNLNSFFSYTKKISDLYADCYKELAQPLEAAYAKK